MKKSKMINVKQTPEEARAPWPSSSTRPQATDNTQAQTQSERASEREYEAQQQQQQ
jgi:hypothetical protein